MDSKKLYSIIIILIIILSFLSYKYNDTNKELKKYKEYYKDLSIMYLNEVIEAPKLEAPQLVPDLTPPPAIHIVKA